MRRCRFDIKKLRIAAHSEKQCLRLAMTQKRSIPKNNFLKELIIILALVNNITDCLSAA